jgi:hypothetical protein
LGLSELIITKRSKLIDYKAIFIVKAVTYMCLNFYSALGFLSLFYLFIFFTCIKKTNQQRSGERKCSRSLDQPPADFPVLLGKAGRCKTRHFQWAQTGSSANPSFPALLGCVKWH